MKRCLKIFYSEFLSNSASYFFFFFAYEVSSNYVSKQLSYSFEDEASKWPPSMDFFQEDKVFS